MFTRLQLSLEHMVYRLALNLSVDWPEAGGYPDNFPEDQNCLIPFPLRILTNHGGKALAAL